MKNMKVVLLSFVFAGFCLMSIAQSEKNHSIGLQLNPYFDDLLFTSTSVKSVYALRYTFSIKDHITFGPEVSGFNAKMKNVEPDYKYYDFNIGGFFRYTFLPSSRIRPFFELSTYYSFSGYKNLPENTYNGVPPEDNFSHLTGYAAPGISLFSKSRKISLDLFYKVSNKHFVNGEHGVLSYRLNYKF